MLFPTSLPIDPHLEALCAQVTRDPVTLIQAPPGTGKTVHLPLALLALGPVWVLEPRRVAARLAAQFATKESSGVNAAPAAVGYHFRNEKRTTDQTRLTYLTEGMLLKLAQSDPQLSRVKVVILDEFHERHISTDTAWAYLRHLQNTKRPDLKIVILSATLDVNTLTAQIPGLTPTTIELTHHPLTVLHRPEASLATAVRETHTHLAQAKTAGSILVFLAGKRDIENAQRDLAAHSPLPIEILHGSLDTQEQARVVATGREPRVILTTNLAESSITVDGVRAVIDAGYYRQANAQPWSGIPELRTRRITRASATQRAGRAARQGAGVAVRLYSAAEQNAFLPFETPELLRSDLSAVFLELLALGVEDPTALPWLDAPPPGTWALASDVLENLQLIVASASATTSKPTFRLTPDGELARRFPTAPRIARLLLDASRAQDSRTCSRLQDLAVGLALEALPPGDCSDLKLPETFAVREERKRLLAPSTSTLPASNTRPTFYSALLSAWGDHAARLKSSDSRGANYLTASGAELWMATARTGAHHAPPEWVVALSVLDSQNGNESSQSMQGMQRKLPQIRAWIPLQEDHLLEAPARFWNDAKIFKWEVDRQTFVQLSQSRFGQILLSETRRFPEPSPELGALLAEKFIALAYAHPESRAWLESTWVRLKIAGLNVTTGNDPWSAVGGLRDLVFPLAATWRSLKDAPSYDEKNAPDVAEAIALHLDDPQGAAKLRKLAPRALTLPKRQAPILYSLTEPPRCESRLQDFLGFKDTPRIGQPPQPLTLVLLAPNYRPVQITQDLASFWQNAYPILRRELMRRYPRHAWPEDPTQLGS